jgi:hypothetical protein
MSSQYPPPPGSEEAHYTPIYPAPPRQNNNASVSSFGGPDGGVGGGPGQQQQQQQHAYAQDMYPKIENLNNVLQQQAQQAQHANHANHVLGDPTMGTLSSLHVMSAAEQQKSNRLRKACDSCSIRKVKVCLFDSITRVLICHS